ncbi:MAG: TonB-dependent receptor [Polyangiales bacterium]
MRAQEGREPSLVPPKVIQSVPATYPRKALDSRTDARVVLDVTVNVEGLVEDARVVDSGGAAFDFAAIDAIKQWTFEPATRNGEKIVALIRVPFSFKPPNAAAVTDTNADSNADSKAMPAANNTRGPLNDGQRPVGEPAGAGLGAKDQGRWGDGQRPVGDPAGAGLGVIDVTARDDRNVRTKTRSASDIEIARDVIEAAPRSEGADILRSAPGVYIARPEGDAVGHRIMLRGFDAEHGQDLEIRLSGIPLNIPSHIHGQGYVDLGFLIGDVVSDMKVSEGVYDPAQGDFAIAGSIDLNLGVKRRGVKLASSFGSFRSFRQLAVWAPKGQDDETFGAVQIRKSNGFGENRGSTSGSAIGQVRFEHGDWATRLLAVAYGARADLAGVVRRDDVQSDRVGFYDVYPYATATAQNGLANRILAGVDSTYVGEDGENAEIQLFFGYDNFRLQENFTGFLQTSRELPGVAGRGDLIEQQNRTFTIGARGRYRSAPTQLLKKLSARFELGTNAKSDIIEQSQNLLDATARNQTWDRRINAGIRALDIGFFGDAELSVADWFTLRIGARADLLSYDVDDRLGNFLPDFRPDQFIEGFRRSAFGVAWGPRTSVEFRVHPSITLLGAYGEGFRSPQARTLEDGERAPFTKVRSADLGVRYHPSEYFLLSVSSYWTRVADDVAFEAREGRLERIGATRRLGLSMYTEVRPIDALLASASLTYVDAEQLERPPGSADDPQPAFSSGQNLPNVPPLVLRIDLGASGEIKDELGKHSLTGRLGTGYSFLSKRPLPFGQKSAPVSLLDASGTLGWGPLQFTLEVFNLFDSRYAAVEYNFVSNWTPDSPASRLPARHLSAGAPRTFMATLGVEL